MILHLCNDLMLGSKVSSWARQQGLSYQSLSSVDRLQEWMEAHSGELGDEETAIVAVDLQLKGLDVASFPARFDGHFSKRRVIGYAQHVMTDLIAEATQAGFDDVLTRGQFDRQFAEYFDQALSS